MQIINFATKENRKCKQSVL
uniref:Uncharacterized protein n=1 Tax=Anguilla anguilla TaxID=7936 RepID=A0A0E9XXB1_ANGAN